MWQIRYIKLVQRIYPDKKGDPTSINFQEQWLASCDEAEKEEIYEASYKTYLLTGKVLPFCTLVAMLLHMVWNTGVLAIIIPAFLWILSASNYCRCCVTKKKRKTCEVNESLKNTYNTIMEVPAASAPPFLPRKGSILLEAVRTSIGLERV